MRPLEELSHSEDTSLLRAEMKEREQLVNQLREQGGLLPHPRQLALQTEIEQIASRLFALETRPMSMFRRGMEVAKYFSRKAGAKATNAKYKAARLFCVREAAEIWRENPNARIGVVSDAPLTELKRKELWSPASSEQVRKWLKEADKEGQLHIPPEARRPGPNRA